MTTDAAQGSTPHRGAPQIWEVAVGRGEDCLKANARRYRVKARNPARAVLSTLRRDNMTMVDALDADLHIAVHPGDNPSGKPVAVFSLVGEPKSPKLALRFARLQPPETPLHQRGGPLDRMALHKEMPCAARRRVEEQLGYKGFREFISSVYWERELTLYCGTAAVLAAIGFPMTPGVFVVGAVLLLCRGLIRLSVQEIRIQFARRRIVQDSSLQAVLSTTAVRRLFARAVDIAPENLQGRLGQTVLRGAVTVPDINGDHALNMYVDEDSRVAVGGLRPARLDSAVPSEDREITAEDLTASDNVLTVVFRRPKKRRKAVKNALGEIESAEVMDEQPEETDKVDLDDLGKESKLPAKVDIDDLGGARSPQSRHGKGTEEEEIVDAEVIEEDQMYRH